MIEGFLDSMGIGNNEEVDFDSDEEDAEAKYDLVPSTVGIQLIFHMV